MIYKIVIETRAITKDASDNYHRLIAGSLCLDGIERADATAYKQNMSIGRCVKELRELGATITEVDDDAM